tara:strand:+ start:199 stop:396 length:198 start_codon:yes stop_codon:yes gene_type:complete
MPAAVVPKTKLVRLHRPVARKGADCASFGDAALKSADGAAFCWTDGRSAFARVPGQKKSAAAQQK